MSMPTPEEMAKWPPPNYVNPDTRVPETLGVLIGGMSVMLFFVAGRIYTRMRLQVGFGVDDWIIFAGVLIVVGTSILGCVSVKYGTGYHIWDLKPEWSLNFNKISLAGTTLFNACVTFPKLSLCFTYLRLFISKGNKVFCYTLLVILLAWLISTCLVTALQCIPVEGYWDKSIVEARCINTSAFSVAAAAVNSATDFLIFWWPARSLSQIKLPLKQRLGLIFVFAVGSMVCVAGVLRMYHIHRLFKGYEIAYDGAIIWITAAIEWNLGIIFACLHSVKPILADVFPSVFGTSANNSFNITFSERSKRILQGGRRSSWFQTPLADNTATISRYKALSKPAPWGKDGFDDPQRAGTGDDLATLELPERAIRYTRRVTVNSRPVDGDEEAQLMEKEYRSKIKDWGL
ncbi:hypothetical protein AJ79_06910 [Helicocarpus griseus UAMH5409]|uniref:Rhodopsin domain-containing protein n=1 Tax=Helicocarpus griseus UAMH5409 TaxID=1447875 RepID=A0A2B7X8B8_9EURO|nr:hypothetical protein AJ79_06910 [Helicocarpus griseus UAMH5409]